MNGPPSHCGEYRRPKVSVCMATHNGERYVEAQLRSILQQLNRQDEVNVVDDASRDRTCQIIRSFNDDRIRLVESEKNRGVLLAFEAAVRMADGDVLFLCDQDDVWYPEKVSTILEAFANWPDVDLMASDAALIDDNDSLLPGTYYQNRGKFSGNFWPNLFRCKFLGATMAFRGTIRFKFLPFPACHDVLHDIWIGMRIAATGGKAHFIEKPLVYYRRHSGNVSRSQSGWRKLWIRVDLLLALLKHSLRRRSTTTAT